jgi:hypothetical protein
MRGGTAPAGENNHCGEKNFTANVLPPCSAKFILRYRRRSGFGEMMLVSRIFYWFASNKNHG